MFHGPWTVRSHGLPHPTPTGGGFFFGHGYFRAAARDSIRASMSEDSHAVVRVDRRIGAGYRPDATPAHHVDRETGTRSRTARRRSRRGADVGTTGADVVSDMGVSVETRVAGDDGLATAARQGWTGWARIGHT